MLINLSKGQVEISLLNGVAKHISKIVPTELSFGNRLIKYENDIIIT